MVSCSNEFSNFDQVGYFKNDRMREYTYFVEKPNKEMIKKFFSKQIKGNKGNSRILRIKIFDNRANTPDVTLKVYYPKSSDPYLYASMWHNPHNGKNEIKHHKQ